MIEPIFILGNPRSGTSLLRSIINSHDNVVAPPEAGFLHFLYDKYKEFKMSDLNNFLDDLFITKKFEGWFLTKEKLKNFIVNQNPNSYQELIFFTYKFYGNEKNKKIINWCDKNNYFINYLDEIYNIFPKQKVIHIVRNPFDVVVSYLKVLDLRESKYKPKFSSNVFEIIDEWVENNNKVVLFCNKNNIEVLTLYYENLITDSENSVNSIFDFIGLDSTSVLDNFNSKKYFDEPEITMDWKRKLELNIDNENMNTHKNLFNIKQLDEMNNYLDSCILNFKYVNL